MDSKLFTDKADGNRQRIESAYKEISLRIARLAMSLGVPLETEADIERVFKNSQVPVELKGGDRVRLEAGGVSERREEQLWDELRGLVFMRTEMQKRCVEVLGAYEAKEVMIKVEMHLTRLGFSKSADGINLSGLEKK